MGLGLGFGQITESGARPDIAANSLLTASVLVTSRDGVVGSWDEGAIGDPSPYSPDSPHNVFAWSPWVRAQIFREMLSAPISVVWSNDDWCNLWIRDPAGAVAKRDDPAPNGGAARILSMKRPGPALFRDQIERVEYWSSLRAERMNEILLETSNILLPMASVVDLNPARRPYTLELLAAFYATVTAIEMQFKNAMACRRPVELSAQVQPMIQTPGHSSYPSGHATETFAFAFLLAILAEYRPGAGRGSEMAEATADQLCGHAYRTTQNRVVAGVHFPVDNIAGAQLGLTLARYLVGRLMRAAGETPPIPLPETGSGQIEALDIEPPENTDFDPSTCWQEGWFAASANGGAAGAAAVEADAVLGELWRRARREWKGAGGGDGQDA